MQQLIIWTFMFLIADPNNMKHRSSSSAPHQHSQRHHQLRYCHSGSSLKFRLVNTEFPSCSVPCSPPTFSGLLLSSSNKHFLQTYLH
uniref:Secreted protein n=1 Tax=Ascaris lumbricoides TaxID=6252 RepID=A0A0M3I972_ASCLU